ncbi:MAG: archease [Chloroflexi bacterium]|nr:archease [Chloroflexota bacterium]
MSDDIADAGFEEIEHTADWSLHVWAPDLAGLLEQAAKGMADLSGIKTKDEERVNRTIKVESTDAEGLLVNFLSELLHLMDEEGLVFDSFDLLVAENVVKATMEGSPIAERKKEIKAVTYHNLKIEKKSNRLEAEIVFDV